MLGSTGPSQEDLPVAKVQMESDVEAASCGDGTKHCTDDHPICCFNGSALQFCCDIAHPVCTPSNPAGSRCLSKFEAAMLESTGPSQEENPSMKVQMEADAEAPCGDGTKHCTDSHPVCCFNGSALQFCCDIAHPVCTPSNPEGKRCLSKFEAAMLESTGPSQEDSPVMKVQMEADAEAPCGDGTKHCTDSHPVCCFNGSALQFCCDIAHPVCTPSNPEGKRCLSRFEAAMLESAGPSQEDSPVEKEENAVAIQMEADADAPCGDGTKHCTDSHPVCCFNGSALQFCCDIAHPVCTPSNPAGKRCLSRFEAAMLAGIQGPSEEQVPAVATMMV
jgi:hypothetical protein